MNEFSPMQLAVVTDRPADELVAAMRAAGRRPNRRGRWTFADLAAAETDLQGAVREALDGGPEFAEDLPLCGRPAVFEFRLLCERLRNLRSGGPIAWQTLAHQLPALTFFALLDASGRTLGGFEMAAVIREIARIRAQFRALLARQVEQDGP